MKLDIDTSALDGQRVMVKYVAGSAAKTAGASPVLTRTDRPSQASPVGAKDEHKSADKSTSEHSTDVDGKQQLSTYWYRCIYDFQYISLHQLVSVCLPPDLISMICRLANDKLDEQCTPPSPSSTPEPGKTSPSAGRHVQPEEVSTSKQTHLKPPSSGPHDSPRQATEEGRQRSGSWFGKGVMQYSRSSDVLDRESRPRTASMGRRQLFMEQEGEQREKETRHGKLSKPTAHSSSTTFHRTRSGVPPSRPSHPEVTQPRSFSPPGRLSKSQQKSGCTSPPPPTTKPPPLPAKARRFTEQRKAISGSDIGPGGHQREEWDDAWADYPHASRDTRSFSFGRNVTPQYFPRAHVSLERNQPPISSTMSHPTYTSSSAMQLNQGRSSNTSHGSSRPSSRGRHSSNSPPQPYEYHQHLDSLVQHAYPMAPAMSRMSHQRQQSAPIRGQAESSTSGHPLQNTVRPAIQHTTSGTAISSYPKHHTQSQQQLRRYVWLLMCVHYFEINISI